MNTQPTIDKKLWEETLVMAMSELRKLIIIQQEDRQELKDCNHAGHRYTLMSRLQDTERLTTYQEQKIEHIKKLLEGA